VKKLKILALVVFFTMFCGCVERVKDAIPPLNEDKSASPDKSHLTLKSYHLRFDHYEFLNYDEFEGSDIPERGKLHKDCQKCMEDTMYCIDGVNIFLEVDMKEIRKANNGWDYLKDGRLHHIYYDILVDSKITEVKKVLSNKLGAKGELGLVQGSLDISQDHELKYCLYLERGGITSNKVCNSINIPTPCN